VKGEERRPFVVLHSNFRSFEHWDQTFGNDLPPAERLHKGIKWSMMREAGAAECRTKNRMLYGKAKRKGQYSATGRET
jgi:hypothetical protein